MITRNLRRLVVAVVGGNAARRWVVFLVSALVLIQGDGVGGLQAAPARPVPGRNEVFDLDGKQILQDEEDLGIVNGKLTTGINYRDVAGVGGLWAPPYVSSNFILDGRVNGEKVPTAKWTWRPFQVRREGRVGDVSVSTLTTLIHGQRAAVVQLRFKNSGRVMAPLELFTLGWLDSVADWGLARPGSRTETRLQADGRCCAAGAASSLAITRSGTLTGRRSCRTPTLGARPWTAPAAGTSPGSGRPP